ncbi:tyrosine-type recombinase/integrase [Imhoffiella purpurea]|uniref:Putative phage integrase n=1 Tax=Imhoffiella purpurea TaxID=1249627 RepID=W9VK31_9GAMM|nr:tyrosine-type recombinase/integrase [Imhoffiella purpurea]EXJ10910.1 putative phage integrase [Imhoffiella purpurea]
MAVKVAELRALKAGNLKRDDGKPVSWLPDDGKRGAGTLLFRAVGKIVRGYFRYAPASGKRDTLAIGQWDEKGRDGMTLDEIRAKADEWRRLYQSGVKNIRGHLEAEEQAKRDAEEATRQAQKAAQAEVEARARFTLGALTNAYCGMLEAKGKTKGAKDARAAFRVHLHGANPDLANLVANEIQAEQIADMLTNIRQQGKDRTAGIVRSYLNAAFNAAIKARLSTEPTADFKGFDIKANPVSGIEAIPVRAGNRLLTHAELAGYLDSLDDGIVDQALRLALLAGGQRMAQLLRATVSDWDHGILRLWDGKGQRTDAREHLLPLGPRGAELVEGLIQRARERSNEPDPSLFLSIGGARVVDSTPGKRTVEIATELGIPAFNLRDVRRTVETELQRLRISRDVRAVLLSHGLGGVQGKHYERYGFIDEKREALLAWERHLEAIQTGEAVSNVVSFAKVAG